MVVTARLPTLSRVSWQERTGLPSTWTVQAPHWAMPQPYLEPTRPRWSRNTHRSGVLGSTSSAITRSSPLTLICMGSPPVFRTGANFEPAGTVVQGNTCQMADFVVLAGADLCVQERRVGHGGHRLRAVAFGKAWPGAAHLFL